jgi:hypothetical protein
MHGHGVGGMMDLLRGMMGFMKLKRSFNSEHPTNRSMGWVIQRQLQLHDKYVFTPLQKLRAHTPVL